MEKVFKATCTMFNELSDLHIQLDSMYLSPILHGISSYYIAMVSKESASLLKIYNAILDDKLSEMNVSHENRIDLLQVSNGSYTTACETAKKILTSNSNVSIDQLFVISASQALCEAVGSDEPDSMLDFKMMSFYHYLHEVVTRYNKLRKLNRT